MIESKSLEINGKGSKTKTIAINTIIVYVRLIVATIIGLLTSRFVLQALGVSDYGLYGVVGGVIAMFSIIAGSLSGTTIRFLNFEIGKKDGNPNKVFNICQITHIVFALFVLILAETVGIFYILNFLNVAPGKEADAMFVFQVSTIVACVGIINVPYQSVFVAKEKFLLIAIIDIVNAVIKLGLVLVLLFYDGNALRLYAIIMSASTFISFVVYHYLCFRYWPELVGWKFFSKYREYKELVVYNNYNLIASIVVLLRTQGSNLIINYFFGTVVNGAYGVARTVEGFIGAFTSNFDTASAPQITQSVGRGDLAEASSIACRACRMCQLLSLMIVFPLYVEMELVLKIWLGNVPEYTVSFCRVFLLTCVVASTGGGFLRLKDAMGKIKWFMLSYSFLFIISLPISIALLKNGYPAVSMFILYIIIDIVCRLTQLALMKIIYDFDVIPFCKKAYTRPFIIVALMACYLFFYGWVNPQGIVPQFVGLVVTAIIGALLVYFIGLKSSEREKSTHYILKLLHR